MGVSDATVLIALAKIGLLHLLESIFGTVLLTPRIETEVVERGLEAGAPEVIHVQQAIEAGWLVRQPLSPAERELSSRLQDRPGVGPGEAEALAVARTRGVMFLADEKRARTVARSLGVETMGCAGVLLEARSLGHLPAADFRLSVARLAAVLWLGPDVVAAMLTSIPEGEP